MCSPGYLWLPNQTGARPFLSLSQKVWVFALVSLQFPGALPTRRHSSPPRSAPRVLLQSEPRALSLDRGRATARSAAIHFANSPTRMLANAYAVPQDAVASFRVHVVLPGCAARPPGELRLQIRELLANHLPNLLTELVTSLTVYSDLAAELCEQAGANFSASATLLVVFPYWSTYDPAPIIDLDVLRLQPGVVSVEPLSVAEVVLLHRRCDCPAGQQRPACNNTHAAQPCVPCPSGTYKSAAGHEVCQSCASVDAVCSWSEYNAGCQGASAGACFPSQSLEASAVLRGMAAEAFDAGAQQLFESQLYQLLNAPRSWVTVTGTEAVEEGGGRRELWVGLRVDLTVRNVGSPEAVNAAGRRLQEQAAELVGMLRIVGGDAFSNVTGLEVEAQPAEWNSFIWSEGQCVDGGNFSLGPDGLCPATPLPWHVCKTPEMTIFTSDYLEVSKRCAGRSLVCVRAGVRCVPADGVCCVCRRPCWVAAARCSTRWLRPRAAASSRGACALRLAGRRGPTCRTAR